ncbi:MAG: UDP-N-acetylmuramate dehydrogenase [Leptolyngbyaceae cyanobacterium]
MKSSVSTLPSQICLPGVESLVKPNVPLASLTSFRVGGPAEWYVAPRRVEDLPVYLKWATTQGLSSTLLGAGSNLLISDRGLSGLVISTRRFRHTDFDPETGRVTVAAGKPLPQLAWQLANLGWSGLEWAVGIPGTVGGAVVMNAGAHGGCVADRLVSAEVINLDGSTRNFAVQELAYAYRTSLLQGKGLLVTQATFQLQPGFDPAKINTITQAHLDQRRSSQPYHLPSCGSVFRNPSQQYKAGWLIEEAGLKGYRIGMAEVAQRHANFILNCGSATAADIFHLIRYVQQVVGDRWSLHLEPEVKILGDFQAAAVVC